MIKFKTSLSFGFHLDRKDIPAKTETRTLSRIVVVAKEIVKKHLLKS